MSWPGTIEAALAPAAESASQMAMMFAVCDPGLNRETHVTLILRWLCGLSPKEIGQAFLVDTQTIDRRLHRGRGRLRQLGRLPDVQDLPDIGARRDSVLRSLYLLFSEGYHGSNPQDPVRPFLCEDSLCLTELLLDAKATAHPDVHALAALFCFDAARLPTRLDEHGVFVPLEDQDRSRWDRARIERGLMHLARSATGDHMSRWHLEAGIACEHAIAPSIQKTDWDRIIGFYQVLAQQSWSPIVALNRALALAERDGIDAGRRELIALAGERKLSRYPFYWAARADLERRAGCHTAARENYKRAGQRATFGRTGCGMFPPSIQRSCGCLTGWPAGRHGGGVRVLDARCGVSVSWAAGGDEPGVRVEGHAAAAVVVGEGGA